MKRYTGQQALYEAISRSRAKARRGNILERFLPEGTKQEKPTPQEGQLPVEPVPSPPEVPQPVAEEPPRPLPEKLREPVVVMENSKLRRLATAGTVEMPPEVRPRPVEKIDRPAPPAGQVQTWWRLRPVQLNAGRVEISVPYHIGIAGALVVTLVVLGAFRIGQRYPGTGARTPARAASQNAATETTAVRTAQDNASAAASPDNSSPRKEGDHWIVLARHKNEADLLAVVDYFKTNDIELRVHPLEPTRQWFSENGLNAGVLPKDDGYLLTTRYLYSNPDKVGTDGYEMMQKIRKVGATYKAPSGKESFAAKRFSDAYGMKVTK